MRKTVGLVSVLLVLACMSPVAALALSQGGIGPMPSLMQNKALSWFGNASAAKVADSSAQATITPTPTPTAADIPEGCYTLTSAADSTKALGIAGDALVDGDRLQVQTVADDNAQKFYLAPVSGGWYRIESVSDGKVLDCVDWNGAEGSNVQQWSYTADDNQMWRPVRCDDGSYSFENRFSGLMLDAGAFDDGAADLQSWKGNGGLSQEFRLDSTVLEERSTSPSRAGYTVSGRTANQIVLVEAEGTAATVSFCEQDSGGIWKTEYATTGFVGADGVGEASEGGDTTPAGSYNMPFAFGNAPYSGSLLTYHQTTSTSVWVDDVSSDRYNTWQETTDYGGERLASAAEAYRYAIVIGYNNPGYLGTMRSGCVPGAGSAFFLHCSTGEPTAGCVSVPTNAMVYMLQHVSSSCRIVIGTLDEVYQY